MKLDIGSRAPLSLRVCLSVCLSVRCPRPFTHFRLTDLDDAWQLGPTLAQTRCFEVAATGAPSGATVNEKPHFRGVTPNASSSTVLNLGLRNFDTMES